MTAALADPMSSVTALTLVALIGIMDPLRSEARQAVRTALDAGIDVRMITGDHTVTARAIADDLRLAPWLRDQGLAGDRGVLTAVSDGSAP